MFCTGGAGDICSAQVRALVYLGADACIIGRNVEKTERMANSMAESRPGARVLGYGAVDVRDYDNLKDAVERCVKELGGIDFVMSVCFRPFSTFLTRHQCWSCREFPSTDHSAVSKGFPVCD